MKKRLLQIAEYLNISVRELERKIGLKRGNIGNMSENSEIGSEKLAKLIDNFPEINANWLLTGKGDMLLIENLKNIENSDWKNEKIQFLQEISNLKGKIIEIQDELIEIKKERVEQVSDVKTATPLTGTYD